MWKYVLGAAVAAPAAAAILVCGTGWLLPRDHVASVEAVVAATPDKVARLVRDVEDQPSWRGGVTAIEVGERRPGGLRYVERSGGDSIAFDFAEEERGRRFRSTIADPGLPFGGAWTIELDPQGGATRVRIEERGFVTNPVYRFFAALVFGHERTMKAYLADLRRAAEQGAEP
ncbi:MAG TPA: SRPBCC family protein [Allosphingosinicella sp.]|jgi:hypothetical protein